MTTEMRTSVNILILLSIITTISIRYMLSIFKKYNKYQATITDLSCMANDVSVPKKANYKYVDVDVEGYSKVLEHTVKTVINSNTDKKAI